MTRFFLESKKTKSQLGQTFPRGVDRGTPISEAGSQPIPGSRRATPFFAQDRTNQCWLAFPIVLAILVGGCAENASAQELQWLSRSDGLPSAQVHSIVQGPGDNLWMATPAGLAHYDGARIRTLSRRDGLTTQGIRSLASGSDGVIWIGSDSGVDVLDSDGLHSLDPDWRWGFVEAMTVDRDGGLWIGSSSGLLRWSRDRGITEVAESSLRNTLIIDLVGDGDPLWILSQDGLFRRNPDGSVLPIKFPVLSQLAPLRRIAARSKGLWVGGDGGLALLSVKGEAEVIARSDGISGVSAILETDDELWVGISGQLRLFRGRRDSWQFERVVLENGLINDIFEDGLGNVWFATDSAGLAKASGLRDWLGVAPRPCETQIYSIAAWQGGYLIGGEFCSWATGPNLEVRSILHGLARVKVWDLLETQNGTLWAATETGLRIGPIDGALTREDFGLKLLQAPNRVLLADQEGTWVGTVAGLARVEQGVAREVLDHQGNRFGYVYTLIQEESGRSSGPDARPGASGEAIWIGTIGRGVFRWTPEGGVERPIPGLEQGNVYTISTRGDGTVALVHDDRVQLWHGGRLRTLEPATRDAVAGWSAAFGPGNKLWVGGLSGLIRYDLDGGPSRRVMSSMGLAGNEFTTSRSLYHAPDGKLILGTEGGLSWLRPEGIDQLTSKPWPQLVEIRWSGVTPTEVDGSLEVAQGRWSMDAELASPWLLDATSLAYRYRLHGFDQNWSDPVPLGEPGIRFTALPPGSYRLEAQINSPLVGWGEAEDLASLTVKPVWWNTALAQGAAALLLGLLVVGLWRWRNRALLRRSLWLEEEVQRRTEDLERLASLDALTGLPNRRSFLMAAEQLIAESTRHEESFFLVVIDLDDFKDLNDRLGHQAGDNALVAVARIFSGLVREEDMLSRYGGDELVLMCPRGGLDEGRATAERLRKALAKTPLFGEGSEAEGLTASFGLASWQWGMDFVTLFRRADLAVYDAKKSKNTVVAWTPALGDIGKKDGVGWRDTQQQEPAAQDGDAKTA